MKGNANEFSVNAVLLPTRSNNCKLADILGQFSRLATCHHQALFPIKK